MLGDHLQAMGLERGLLSTNGSGYVVADFAPLLLLGRAYHNSIAKDAYVPPGVKPIFTTLFTNLTA